MSLHLDKRPKTLDEFLGNDGIKESLYSVFTRKNDAPHSVLFIGPSGCGKTTLARIVATMLGCDPASVEEYNSSNTRGIDTIRMISENAQFSPLIGRVKVYIIDECHKMTNDAQNAILKILEDTPKHVYFILCTTDPERLIKAIRTRCMTFEVKGLPCPVLTKLINDTLASEGITDFPSSVVNAIVKGANNCPRQALVLLDSVIDIMSEEDALRAISEAIASETLSIDLCKLLLEERKNKWNECRVLLKGLDEEPEKMRYAILGYLDAVLLSDNCRDPKRISALIDCFRESYIYVGKAGLHSDCLNACEV
jgi:DNA polymerase-3 subunit gamma/tau